MARKIKRKTQKIIKKRIFKDFRKSHLLHRRSKRSKTLDTKISLPGTEQLSDVGYSNLYGSAHTKTSDYAAFRQADKTFGQVNNRRHDNPAYRRYNYSKYKKKPYGQTSFNRTYGNSFGRAIKTRVFKKSIIYLLISAIILLTVINPILSSNTAISFLGNLSNFIENTDVQRFKSVFNNLLPIIDVTYNSGNIGNPISVQVKALVKNIFGFDIGIPITILNAQSPFLHNYYENEYIPCFAEHRADNKEDEFIDKNKGTNSQGSISNSNKSSGSGGNGVDTDNEGSLASRSDNLTKNGRGDNIEEVEDGIISYYYYEGEEEKFEEPKENISSGQKINILNMTNYKIVDSEINKLLKEPLNIKLDEKGPEILILHTHSTESFVKKPEDINVKSAPLFSRNPQENVVRVGHELSEHLKKYGFNVIHNGTEHDIPDHNKSYNNAYDTIEKYLKSYPSIKVVLDIHRDGLSKEYPKLRVAKNIDGKSVAQIMFVIGTNHASWKENLKLALKLQDNLNSRNPGIARHIYLSNNRYNQHFTNGSLIIEVGGEGNLLSECLESTKYLARAISEVIR